MKTMKYFKKKYGPDFEKKLSMYKTATLNGEYVSILLIEEEEMLALVLDSNKVYHSCSVYELDDFCL